MRIRTATPDDLERLMEIYAIAREFMAASGNPLQWGEKSWPPESLIQRDIESGKSHVCEHDGRIVGVFYLDYGPHIEPTYEVIEDGTWIGDDTYGVVHRIASDGSVKGVGKACIEWALAQCGHLRIDTHGDNAPMQGLLTRLGFERCGIIHIEEDDYPRIAFEKIAAADR